MTRHPVTSLRSRLRRRTAPQLSVIVPVHNAGEYVAQALESIISQPPSDLEVICVDDGSTDDSATVLARLATADPRIRVLSGHNRGVAAARNRGLLAARGDYVRFVDADDALPLRSNEILLNLAREGEAQVAMGALAVCAIECEPSAVVRLEDLPNVTGAPLPEVRDLWVPWWLPSCIIDRAALARNGAAFPPLVNGEDIPFLARQLADAERIAVTSDCVYYYRRYEKSTGSGLRGGRVLWDFFTSIEMTREILLERHAPCWHEGYAPFIKSLVGVHLGIAEATGYGQSDIREAELRVLRLFGSPITEHEVREESWWPRDWTRPTCRPKRFDVVEWFNP